ncbi:Cupredoxin [Dentipellis sp. KUC8613]|nr:Cupredoxin [Dentipellis sp. KUC8613]
MLFSSVAAFIGIAASLAPSALAWGGPATHDVQVGPNGQLVFDPMTLEANVGDKVVFHFNPKNHSVTQSSFQMPCTNLSGGFDSGFHPVPAGTGFNQGPTFEITVDSPAPIWVHCNQMANTPGSHCGAGMVLGINPGAPGTNNSFQDFLDIALAIGVALKAEADASAAEAAGLSAYSSIESTAAAAQKTGH